MASSSYATFEEWERWYRQYRPGWNGNRNTAEYEACHVAWEAAVASQKQFIVEYGRQCDEVIRGLRTLLAEARISSV